MSLISKVAQQLFEDYNNDAQDMIDIIKNKMGYSDEKFKKVSGARFKLLVPADDRYQIRDELGDIEGFEVDTSIRGSSIGGVKYKSAVALIKPESMQGRKSAGLDNEDIFENKINEVCSEANPIDVWLNDYKVTNVIKARGVGTQTHLYKKTDIVLERKGEKDFNISIKKDNAEIWESADTRYRQLLKDFVQEVKDGKHKKIYFKKYTDKSGKEKKGIYKMYNTETDNPVSGVVKRVSDISTVKEIIWGGDEVDVVLVRTFRPNDFMVDDKGLHVMCTELVWSLKDVEQFALWPILKIRHDSTREKTFGLRPVVMTERSIMKTKVKKTRGSLLPLRKNLVNVDHIASDRII